MSNLKNDYFSSFKKLILWSDGGPHFKNKKLFFFFSEFSEELDILIEHNFLLPNHGASECDEMFGRLKQLETREKVKGNRPNNKQDYTNLIIEVKTFKGCRKFFQFYYTQTGSVQARHLSNEGNYELFPLEEIETPTRENQFKKFDE
ncbi:hypothetical protein M0811_10572 [Anaeramoeba ignava]|uniref:Uncharacterized protein n=1 Tax=Anaeramoeba ignava TaxID=1746090 RepID=A0A9Q0LE78_ANAIG|nr:hypothetical protein M0811_10572 [Anaeramoeba ignava]